MHDNTWVVILNELYDPDLRLDVGLNVSLLGTEVRVPGKHLHVPERSANGGNLPRGIMVKLALSRCQEAVLGQGRSVVRATRRRASLATFDPRL
jgi:hypothetical protein